MMACNEGSWHWQADESGATISVAMGSGGEGEASDGGTSMQLNAPPRARRTPRGGPAPSIMRSGGRVSPPLANSSAAVVQSVQPDTSYIML